MLNKLPAILLFTFMISCGFHNGDGENTSKISTEQDTVQAIYDESDIATLRKILNKAKKQKWKKANPDSLIIMVGNEFLGTSYVASVLDQNKDEILTTNLSGLDCVTFVENVLAIAQMVKNEDNSFQEYLKSLRNIRYRNGQIDNYCSRLHYFSDWIYENEKKGLVKEKSKKIANTEQDVKFSFMGEHPKSYHQLVDTSLLIELKKIENNISRRTHYYIPEKEMKNYENQINNGDIIAITTNIEGLDVVHTGYAINVKGRLHLFHASSKSGKIEISDTPLAEMLKRNKIQTGIKVVRPIL